jgi:hypothetical protein
MSAIIALEEEKIRSRLSLYPLDIDVSFMRKNIQRQCQEIFGGLLQFL